MSKPEVFLRQATLEDGPAIVDLLNLTFRSDVGWTNESHLVGGIRTTLEEIASIINDDNTYFFVFPEVDHSKSSEQDSKSVSPDSKSQYKPNSKPDSNFNVPETGKLLGSISVKFKPELNSAYIGLFAVDPNLQGVGVGNQILSAAETFAERHLRSKSVDQMRLTMSILSQRPDLLEYYQRRGYQLSGQHQPFPIDSNNGEPKVEGLQLLELEKRI